MIETRRGQTTVDFAIGISLFLVVLVFVFLFVPDLLQPFTAGAQEETVAVNRIADELSQRMLGSASEPYVLGATCTKRFFAGESPGDCGYSGATLAQRLDLESRQHVNVTVTDAKNIEITDRSNVLCWNATTDSLTSVNTTDCTPASGDVSLQAGENLRQGSVSSVSARRIVLLDNQTVSIKVVMW